MLLSVPTILPHTLAVTANEHVRPSMGTVTQATVLTAVEEGQLPQSTDEMR